MQGAAVDGAPSREWSRGEEADVGSGASDLYFALAPDVIAVIGFDGVIRRVNATALAVSGWSAAELVGSDLRRFIHPDDLHRVEGTLSHLAMHGKSSPMESRILTRSGAVLWYEWHSARLNAHELVTFGRDISARKLTELTLTMADQAMGDMAQGYWVHDIHRDTAYFSAECARLIGRGPVATEMALGQFIATIEPGDRERVGREIREAHADPSCDHHTVRFRIVRADGSVRHCLSSARLRRDADGRVAQAVGTMQDITEPLALQNELRVEQELGSAIFSSTGAFIIVFDGSGAVLRFNPAAERATGWSCAELRRIGWAVLIPEDERASARGRFEAMCEGTFPGAFTSVWLTRDGRSISIAWSNAVIRDEEGRVRHVIATGMDVSGLKETHEQLRTARRAYRRLLESTCDMVVTQAHDGTILDINAAGARVLGAPDPQEIAGLHLRDIVPPEDLPLAMVGLEETVRLGERKIGVESRALTRDGRIVDVEVIATAATSWYGQPAIQTVLRDLTEKRNAERALRQREQQMATLARAAPVGIFEIDLHGQCTYSNERYQAITGYSHAETSGNRWWDHIVPEDLAAVRGAWRRMEEHGDGFRLEYRVRRKDGAVIWVLALAAPEPGDEGHLLGYIGSITDINKSKLDEIELRNYREHLEEMVRERTIELEAVNRELESFSYSVSHDLRAPLRAINGFNGALLEEYGHQLDDDARFLLRRVQANTRQMAQLIDDLLQLSKVTQAELQREWVDLSAVAERVLGELRQTDPARQVSTIVGAPLKAFGDPQLLGILMQNLLGNAWKYTGRNPAPATIEFGITFNNGTWAFFVRDNGVGFDMSCAPHLFRAFQRLHDSSQFEGTGIGLATAHRIVTRHGGRIWAEAREGEGATFLFTLAP